jgi:hypothetical protein
MWLRCQRDRPALRQWYHALPPLTLGEMPLLAALSLFAAWRSVSLLVVPDRQMALAVLAADVLAALALFFAVKRFRRR